MKNLILHQTKDILSIIDAYPEHVSDRLYKLRQFILDIAEELATVPTLEETTKWGEPSYIAKKGTTIRINWSTKTPDQYALYVPCSTKVIPSARAVIGDQLNYEGSRAVIFSFDEPLPKAPLSKVIKAALTYHHVKNLEHLGMVK